MTAACRRGNRTVNRDNRHLHLLSRWHYGLAIGILLAIVAAGVCLKISGFGDTIAVVLWFPIVALAFLALVVGDPSGPQYGEGAWAAFLGSMVLGAFLGMILAALVAMATLVWLIFLAVSGWLLKRRRGYWVCYLVAIASCAFFPLGTVLGVVTLKVLSRPNVRASFSKDNGLIPPVQ
ncbi:hypothetical protein LCGC14_0181890 [marine sediment metagenome]|uniref:Uncharacterized protein n=1 Tax=marine sediment metagenome TaxID=412755 RepID=A0A0F9UPP9_9ZZZZ